MEMTPIIAENGLAVFDISSMDIDSLKTYSPPSDGFMIVIDLCIGKENEKGMDDFRFTLVDRNGLLKYIVDADSSFIKTGVTQINGYNIMIIDHYSYSKLESGIREILKSIDTKSNNWTYIASQLNCYLYWEYEREFRRKLK